MANSDQLRLPGLLPDKDKQRLPVSCKSYGVTRDFGPDCYFWDSDRCLGRSTETCSWSIKVGNQEWLCAHPWKDRDPDHA